MFTKFPKQITLFIVLFFSIFSFSQTKNLIGVVSDTLNMPLENANVIAKPFGANAQLKFAIADNKGRFRLELEEKTKQKITNSLTIKSPQKPLLNLC